MSRYFDRAGEPMSLEAWGTRFGDMEYKRVAFDKVGEVEVSTVWLGLNHRFNEGPPLIFETMVFGGPMDQECNRYSTETEALAGHAHMVAVVRGEVESV